MRPLRVVVCDDHPVVREGLSALLGSRDDVDVVAVAADGPSAVRQCVIHRPDVVLLDVHMPGGGGLDAAVELGRAAPDVGILVLTMDEDDDVVLAVMRAGARGYLLKGAEQDEIVAAIRTVAGGQTALDANIARRLVDAASHRPTPAAARPFPSLTGREREVLELLARGLGNAAIAEQLFLSAKTVANHVSNLFAKLGVADRPQAIVLARDAGLGRTPAQ